MKLFAQLIASAAILAAAALPAAAQDVSADPNYETVTLTHGFPEDPYVVQLQSGGGIDASELGGNCGGFIANAPDVRLNYEAGSLPLYLTVAADVDTTLVVNGPDGEWYCDDDGAGGLDPMVWFSAPASGQYDIWVGTYADSELHDAQLNISELTPE